MANKKFKSHMTRIEKALLEKNLADFELQIALGEERAEEETEEYLLDEFLSSDPSDFSDSSDSDSLEYTDSKNRNRRATRRMKSGYSVGEYNERSSSRRHPCKIRNKHYDHIGYGAVVCTLNSYVSKKDVQNDEDYSEQMRLLDIPEEEEMSRWLLICNQRDISDIKNKLSSVSNKMDELEEKLYLLRCKYEYLDDELFTMESNRDSLMKSLKNKKH